MPTVSAQNPPMIFPHAANAPKKTTVSDVDGNSPAGCGAAEPAQKHGSAQTDERQNGRASGLHLFPSQFFIIRAHGLPFRLYEKERDGADDAAEADVKGGGGREHFSERHAQRARADENPERRAPFRVRNDERARRNVKCGVCDGHENKPRDRRSENVCKIQRRGEDIDERHDQKTCKENGRGDVLLIRPRAEKRLQGKGAKIIRKHQRGGQRGPVNIGRIAGRIGHGARITAARSPNTDRRWSQNPCKNAQPRIRRASLFSYVSLLQKIFQFPLQTFSVEIPVV